MKPTPWRHDHVRSAGPAFECFVQVVRRPMDLMQVNDVRLEPTQAGFALAPDGFLS